MATFNTNLAFKWLTWAWGDYSGESFVKSGFFGTVIPRTWAIFIMVHLVCKYSS